MIPIKNYRTALARKVFDIRIHNTKSRTKEGIKELLENGIRRLVKKNPEYVYESIERRIHHSGDYEYRIVLKHYLVIK